MTTIELTRFRAGIRDFFAAIASLVSAEEGMLAEL